MGTAGTQSDVESPAQQFGRLEAKLGTAEYNFEHFRTEHLLADVRRTLSGAGIRPGEMAPDFELPRAGGGTLRLGDLRGRPILLHFGSYT